MFWPCALLIQAPALPDTAAHLASDEDRRRNHREQKDDNFGLMHCKVDSCCARDRLPTARATAVSPESFRERLQVSLAPDLPAIRANVFRTIDRARAAVRLKFAPIW